MNILKPNSGKEVHYILNTHIYVKVWDYGKKFLLSHWKQSKSTDTSIGMWTWISLSEGEVSDITELSHLSFEEAINKAVNNPYCTVYEFASYEEMAIHWEDIRYVDTITTTYTEKR